MSGGLDVLALKEEDVVKFIACAAHLGANQCDFQVGTMVDNSQEYRLQYWATRSFVRTAQLFACSGLLASLAPSAALTRSLVRSGS